MSTEAVKDFARAEIRRLAGEGRRVFVGLDPTTNRTLVHIAGALGEEARCLYTGAALAEYGDSAPWIAADHEQFTVADYLVDNHLGDDAFVLFVAPMTFDEFHLKMRRFTKVGVVGGAPLFFRLFKPDTLGTTLPFLTGEQRAHVFAGLDAVAMEIGAGEGFGFGSMRFAEDGTLRTRVALPDAPEPAEAVVPDVAAALPPDLALDLEGAAVRPMLTLTAAQIEAPVLFDRPKLVRHTIEALREDYAAAIDPMPRPQLAMHVNHGIDLALSYGLADVAAVQAFVDIMFAVAPGWHRQPELNRVLRQREVKPLERLELATHPRHDAAWRDAARYDDVEEWFPGAAERDRLMRR
jgi:hypothetical protein